MPASETPDPKASGWTSAETLATNAILAVISRAAAVLVVGILVWGFNKVDRALDQVNSSLQQVQVSIGRLETERDSIKEKLNTLDARMWDAEKSLRHAGGR